MMEPKGKSKADVSARDRIRSGCMARDWLAVHKAFEWYGCYLLLIGQDHPVGEARVFSSFWNQA
jgi:hypothetical protein